MSVALKKTITVAADGKYEPFKTTPIFDSTAAHIRNGWDTRRRLENPPVRRAVRTFVSVGTPEITIAATGNYSRCYYRKLFGLQKLGDTRLEVG